MKLRRELTLISILLLGVGYFLFAPDPHEDVLPSVRPVSKKTVSESQGKPVPTTVQDPLTEELLLQAVNVLREEYGLVPFQRNSALMQVAATRAYDMRDREYLADVSPIGESVSTVAAQAGYSFLHIGEIRMQAAVQDAAAVVSAWLEVEDDATALLSNGFRETGIAISAPFGNESEVLIVQVFGVPSTVCTPPQSVLQEEVNKNIQLLATLGYDFNDSLDSEELADAPAEVVELFEVTTLLVENVDKAAKGYTACLADTAAAVKSRPKTPRASTTPQ